MYIYIYIYIYIRRPFQSVDRVRLQPSKSTMLFNIQAQAARQQPKQPRMTHACSSPGWMLQSLINNSSYRGHSWTKSRATARPSPSPPTSPWALKLMLPPAQECQIGHLTSIQAFRHPSIHASGPRGRRQRR